MSTSRDTSRTGSGSDRASQRNRSVLWPGGSGDGAPRSSGEPLPSDRSRSPESNGWVRHGTALPGWSDLEPSTNRKRTGADDTFLQNVSTGRFALLILAVAGLFTLYVGHVHTTTDLYNQLQQARTQNQQLHLKHNRLEGAYDRRTGASVIYERARALGLQESVSYGPPIRLSSGRE